MFGLQVMPFLAIEAPPCHSWLSASPTVRSVPGPVKCRAEKRSPFIHEERLARFALCCAQADTGSATSTREAAKIASASLKTASSSEIGRGSGRERGGKYV